MTPIDTQIVTPSLSVRRSLGVPTSKLSIWPKKDTDIGASISSTTVHSHSDTSAASGSPISLSSSLYHKSSATSLGLQNKAQKDHEVHFPKVRQGKSNVFLVHRKRARIEAPGSPLQYSSDSGPLATSLCLQDNAKRGRQAHLSSLHRSEVFVRCDTPDKNFIVEYYTQQTGAQHSSSTPQPPFVSDSSKLVNSSTAMGIHEHDDTKDMSSLARVPDSRLGLNPIIAQDDTAKRRPSKKNVLLDEDRILAWLEDVSKAMDKNQ